MSITFVTKTIKTHAVQRGQSVKRDLSWVKQKQRGTNNRVAKIVEAMYKCGGIFPSYIDKNNVYYLNQICKVDNIDMRNYILYHDGDFFMMPKTASKPIATFQDTNILPQELLNQQLKTNNVLFYYKLKGLIHYGFLVYVNNHLHILTITAKNYVLKPLVPFDSHIAIGDYDPAILNNSCFVKTLGDEKEIIICINTAKDHKNYIKTLKEEAKNNTPITIKPEELSYFFLIIRTLHGSINKIYFEIKKTT